ncbi:hypothetical protein IU459_31680 [Nocardia amamiensis]|uniref:Uncharacterized protein n=1 Tax=Nocardia amamiensis TaxID=404578 RepID=A0ABS0D243_9NOCA|nr:hypothetical protein [Nocardia amamiensis]MBF6302072.1 hypothetical protein [Nocardia amamiensis]
MSRTGEVIDAATAFVAAAVAGVTLFLPVAVRARPTATSYQLTGLLNNVPRSAALAVIVAVIVAVVITTTSRPVLGWATAATGSVAQVINHLAAPQVSSADLLTTQNYLDAVCAAVVLGALGAVVLHRALPAAGFALGGIGFFAFGGLARSLGIDPNLYAASEAPPRWLIVATAALLITSTLRHMAPIREPEPPRMDGELPLAPIFAASVLAVVVLTATEWLGRQFSKAPDDSHVVDIGIVVAATIISATAAAMLLPWRDGVGVYLAVCLTAAADAVGYAPRPAWAVALLIMLAAVGIAAGNRAPSTAVAITLIAGIAIFAITGSTGASSVGFVAISIVIALTAGYCCGVARPSEASSGVLAIAALYLPTVVSVSPYAVRNWHGEDPAHSATPGIAALALAIGSALGLVALYRFRPSGPSHLDGRSEDEPSAQT